MKESICYYCSEVIDDIQDLDHNDEGFWCDCCDGFTFYDPKMQEQHRFTLILEHKLLEQEKSNNSANHGFPKLKRQLSPLRYPGGKSRMIPYLYQHLQKNHSEVLASPFTGGGSFELSMLESGVVRQIELNDLDYGIYSLWWVMLYEPYSLIDRIKYIEPSRKRFFQAQSLIKSGFIGADPVDAAWATLLVNRLAYSGIAKANPLGGKKGDKRKLLSRWNPTQLIERIHFINTLSDKINISCMEATSFIEEMYWLDNTTLFIDPPYISKGKELYNHYYTERDHIHLSVVLDELYKGMPGADILVTYDYSKWLEDLYEYPDIKVIQRKYSI